jgi:hypothetical protein
MERAGLPAGIPSLPEFFADYCSLAVSNVTKYFQFGRKSPILTNEFSMPGKKMAGC